MTRLFGSDISAVTDDSFHHHKTLLVSDLQKRLDAVADEPTKTWFENYLKNAIRYRGVKTPEVAQIVTSWRKFHDLQQLTNETQFELANSLIRQQHAEDKFAGIVYIQKYLHKRLAATTLLDSAENLFSIGAFVDWSTTDWFCVRVLGPTIVHHGGEAATRISGWCRKPGIWNRRASIVPFRSVIRDRTYLHLIESTIAVLVREQDRFIQTGVGWVISDLSKTFPHVAEQLVEQHFDDLSVEVIRRHTKFLPDHRSYKSRKRATTKRNRNTF